MQDNRYFPNEPSYFVPDQLDRLLVHAYELGSSDISIQSGEAVISEINGCLYRITNRRLTQQECVDLINHIYGANAAAMIFSGTDIDTNYRVRVGQKDQYRFRVNITACMFDGYQGLQITLRTISSSPPELGQLNIEQEIINAIKIPQGVMVVSGATGSGKSTLLASLVADLVKQEDSNLKVLTYESPIEYVYDNVEKPSSIVSQTEIPRYLPSFAAGVRNALRRKPGLILVGEARDQETIEAVIDAALTGHPVYTTVHANGVADTMRRMVTIFPHEERDARLFDLLEVVKVIVWQALVATPDGKRVALREYIRINDEVRDALLGTPVDQLVTVLRKLIPEHGQSIRSVAEAYYKEGKITEKAYHRFVIEEEVVHGS